MYVFSQNLRLSSPRKLETKNFLSFYFFQKIKILAYIKKNFYLFILGVAFQRHAFHSQHSEK